MADVYIGFMDEEVRPILVALLQERWNVLVIERENIDPQGILFERPISAYPKNVMWKGWCGFNAAAGKIISEPNKLDEEKLSVDRRTWLNIFQQCMHVNMSAIAKKLPAGILEVDDGQPIKRKLGLIPSVSMLYMGTASGRRGGLPTKILIRSPEMGLQPGLIRTQLRGILKALKSASNARPDGDDYRDANKINIWSYGAGGAYCTHPDGGPGTVWNTLGSIYLGVERDKSAEIHRPKNEVQLFKGEIAYCSNADRQTLYTTPSFYTIAEARTRIESVFKDNSRTPDSLLHEQIGSIARTANIPDDRKLGISITSNSFMGDEVKKAAREYHLKGGVNMEDYHLFKLIQSLKASQKNYTSVKYIEARYPYVQEAKVIRIDADPAEIPLDIQNIVVENNEKTITLDKYSSILKWGLEGMDLDEIPTEISWSGVAGIADIEKYLISTSKTDKIYINPFLLEAAQDLFKEVGMWLNKISKEKDPRSVLYPNPFNQKDFFAEGERNVDNEIENLQKSYRILNDNLRLVCKKQAEEKKEIKLGNCTRFMEDLYVLVGLWKSSDELPIWARGGWNKGSEKTYTVENMKYSGANIDRAFYKSSNALVLQQNAKKAVTTYFS